MRFTVDLAAFVRMVETVSRKMPNRQGVDARLKLLACDARVFVSSNQTLAGVEALVLKDGRCTLPRAKFLKVLKTYLGKPNLTIEADEYGLRIGGFSMPLRSYSPYAESPGEFQVFPVTDDWLVAKNEQQPAPPPDSRWLSTRWWE